MALDLTAMDAALKELYAGQTVPNMVYSDNPFLAMVPKRTDFVAKRYPMPIITASSQGRSSVFATAQTNEVAPEIESFLLTRVRDYGVGRIDRETMLASETDKGAFLEGAKLAVDSVLMAVTNSLTSSLFRAGTGSIGKIAAGGITSGVITLDDPTSVTQFERNMVLQAAQTDGGTLEAGLGYVIAVNRSAGTVTVASSGFGGSAATPSGWSAGDFLLVEGDKNAKIKGLAAWLPATAPTGGDNFFGVDRSVDPTRLAGVRYDGSAQSIEEALIDGSSLLAREGGRPDVAIVSYASYAALEKSLGSKVQYVNPKVGEVGFRGIALNGANSMIQVFPDRSQVRLTCHLLSMKSWKLMSLKDAPHIFDYDGDASPMLRVGNADQGEVRVGYYAQLACNAPGHNAVITLDA